MFITFEGIDGSGKSTQAAYLTETLRQHGAEVLLVREPGGTILGEAIRRLVLDPAAEINARAELLLFSAARAELVSEVIDPALQRGTIVVADRYFDSSTAYQGGGRGLADPTWLESLHAFATNGLRPDRTFLVDIDPDLALARRDERSADRVEQADRAFHHRVRDAYLASAELEPERFEILDGTQSRGSLRDSIWQRISTELTRGN